MDEDKETKEWMRKYGINKVRGGSYAAPTLTAGQMDTLKREINHAEGRCLRCGGEGHMARACPQARKEEGPEARKEEGPEARKEEAPTAKISHTMLARAKARAKAQVRAQVRAQAAYHNVVVPMDVE